MVERRPQGRPTRGPREVGRDKIIENLRAMMHQVEIEDFSRKNLARYSGVTPALITYYFPSREALIEETTAPIIARYYHDLQAIIAINAPPTARLREVVRLLITCHARDGRILAAYKELLRRNETGLGPNYIELMAKALSGFLDTFIGEETSRPPETDLLQCAIWGMCEFVARGTLDTTAPKGRMPDDPGSEIDLSERLFDFIAHGLSFWVPGIALDPPTRLANQASLAP